MEVLSKHPISNYWQFSRVRFFCTYHRLFQHFGKNSTAHSRDSLCLLKSAPVETLEKSLTCQCNFQYLKLHISNIRYLDEHDRKPQYLFTFKTFFDTFSSRRHLHHRVSASTLYRLYQRTSSFSTINRY